jgi:S-adenosylmethionine:tRNA ribosyltransferase-isomerase
VTDAGLRPAHLEASEPPEARGLERDAVRLLVSHADTDSIAHARFRDLPRWLSPGDVLVVNTSGTLNAALQASTGTGDPFDLHVSTRLPGGFWVVEVRRAAAPASLPYTGAQAGTTFELEGGGRATILAPYPLLAGLQARSRLWIAAVETPEPLLLYLGRVGRPIRYSYVPQSWPASSYQTVFATEPGSAEMPSAGRPFSHELVTRLVANGVQIAPLLLHTGVASLEDHEPPYEEYFRVPPETAERVSRARRTGRRVVAVGTTVVRALETVTDERGRTSPGEGWTGLVITRDRPLRAVTGMITGLHEPRATHLAIVEQAVAAAGGHAPSAHLERAYREADGAGYLWHEFGDSHLIIGAGGHHAERAEGQRAQRVR